MRPRPFFYKMTAALAVLIDALSLTACASSQSSSEPAASGSAPVAAASAQAASGGTKVSRDACPAWLRAGALCGRRQQSQRARGSRDAARVLSLQSFDTEFQMSLSNPATAASDLPDAAR